ncbi:hypothetical protein PQR71_10250 [Paraburkholderia fungorum]|uniref:hypothetical protein n=1 Tax=Paraburkholderia fungorum TaxID=134537 RepID=UPI0038B88F97
MSTPMTRYLETYDEFSSLVDYSIALIEAQVGYFPTCDRQSYAEKIFLKLVCHGMTLRRLSPAPRVQVVHELWDVSSNYAVARTLIETFEALSYIALEPVSATEREFRILLWKLHAAERRSKMLDLIGSTHADLASVLSERDLLKEAALAHPFLATADNGLSKKIERGDPPPYHLSRSERDKRCGIDSNYHNAVTMHLSQHVHTYPFSVFQLFEFRAGDPECLRLMSVAVEYAAGFLAKSLAGMIDLFSPRIPQLTPSLKQALETWQGLLAAGLTKF